MRITIPIRGPEYEKLEREYEHFIKDLSNYGNNPELIKLIDNEEKYRNIQTLTFTIIKSSELQEKTDDRISAIKSKHPNFHTKYIDDFLVLNLTLKTKYLEKWGFHIFVNNLIQKLSLLVNLSYATKVDFLEGVIYDNDEYVATTELLISTIDYAYQHADDMNWPRLKSVDFNKTVNWFVTNNIHLDGNSKNKLHRAINAFSYLFSNLKEKDTSQLFWNMLGIEALLAEGTNSISSQIRVKSSLVLGEPLEYKKKLTKLYDYRSRFIHGDFNFPAKFSADFEIFEDEYWDYLTFSSSILLALIRKLIEKSENEYKFEYKLSD